MSLKYEQYNSLKKTKNFLQSIALDTEKTRSKKAQEIKTKLKKEAFSCLRHFPFLTGLGQPIFSNDDFFENSKDEITNLYNCVFEASSALRLIASPRRSDGTYNNDRDACRHIAEQTIEKIEKLLTPIE